MTLIVSVLTAKGGTGKTTTAVYLAAALERNYSVEVWDSDPQATATTWAAMAAEDGDPLPFPVHPVSEREIVTREASTDVVLIDTPPGNPKVMNAAARRSDVVIIPTAPKLWDLHQLWGTADALGNTPIIVLVTQANTRTRAYREALEALEDQQFAVFDAAIKATQTIERQSGTNPKKLGAYGDVALELMKLTKEL